MNEKDIVQKRKRQKELTGLLKAASRAYYQEDREIMPNLEYDRLYDELVQLEHETGTVLAGSPSVSVGFEAVDTLPRERHDLPMLSLDKTKDPGDLVQFAGDHEVLMSWKLDGLTVVLTYQGGGLVKAVTRGNGEIGEVITPNARVFQNIPLQIPWKGELVLRGEAIITYPEFERINAELKDADARYKNPRNLCSGSVRQLDSAVTAQRHVRFYAFALVRADGVDFRNARSAQLDWLGAQGFEVVEYKKLRAEKVRETVSWFAEKIRQYEVPSDGLVMTYEDIAYGQSLGRTAKFPRDSIAFKWKDETRETKLRYIEWSPSRTGLINPVAVFEPVELEGSTVSRASVHNVSIVKALELGAGDTISVYKANMIIPQIAENLTRSGGLQIPDRCPACGGATEIRSANDAEMLYCTNENCSARKIKAFTLFVSRDAMNIEGLSEATLEKFIAHGFLHTFADVFRLSRHRDAIMAMDGFGEKSYAKLEESIRRARNTTLPRLLISLGIPNIGVSNARLLCQHFAYDLEALRKSTVESLTEIGGLGEVIAASVAAYFADKENGAQLDALLAELHLEKPETDGPEKRLAGKTFVITGSVERFANRSEMKAYIEERGGKVTGSVTKNTSYLINNDTASASAKNRKAKELGIPILSEQEFLAMSGPEAF